MTEMEQGGSKPSSERPASLRLFSAGVVSLATGVVQAACVWLMAGNAVKALLGVGSSVAASGSSFFHSAPVRLPLMTFAALTASFTLFVVGNGWRLRNRPAAQWRRKPLSPRQKVSSLVAVAFSVLSLILVFAEILAHNYLHQQ
jgi:hypothetical protein